MSYYDEQPQASDPLSNPRVVTAIVLAIAGLIAIVGCVGLYFFIGGRSAGQPTLVVAVTSLPTNTQTFTPIPSETPEPTTTPGPNDISTTLASPTTEGFGGGGGPRYATLSEIRGLVEYKNDTVGDWKAATSEVSVPAGTSIRTSESSSVKLTLNEGTVIRASSQTQFTLRQLTGDDADPTTTLTLDFGKIWNVVANTPGTTNFEVITPYGKASVRGGAFMSTEHNSTEELDIITCLESVKGCSYSVDGVGVQGLSTGQMLIYKQGD
ncbi:MAG: FecR family protein, partial [Chloroflexota bacterium]